jgi:hypothetical protein
LLALREFSARQSWNIYREYVDQVTGAISPSDNESEAQQ